MTDRIPCTTCGASILHATAERTGGLCKPCKGGYRENIEQGKIHYELEKQYRETDEYKNWDKHWTWLVNQVHKPEGGFQSLSHPNKLFYAVNLIKGQVFRGGFEMYFRTDSADSYEFALEGLSAMGATESLKLLISAKQLFFGENALPATEAERWDVLKTVESNSQENQSNELDLIEHAFYKDLDELDERLRLFAMQHDLYKNF
jgi:Domain of unknown function (DUF4375)